MDEGKEYIGIGTLRMKYIDIANHAENTEELSRSLDKFLDTIPPGSNAAKYIKEQFDKIEIQKNIDIQELIKYIKELGDLEQSDKLLQGKLALNNNSLHDKRIICWNAMIKYKLNLDENENDYKP